MDNKKDWWIVATNAEGIVLTTDNFAEALSKYQSIKEEYKDYINDTGEFYGDEDIILAKIQKRFVSIETDKKDEEGNNYYDWQEDIFNDKEN